MSIRVPKYSATADVGRSDSMGREINIHAIRELEKQIEEATGNVIQLKRARNSLLNISTRVPPEILGSVFRWNVIPKEDCPDFCGLRRGSYNFVLVCHHWFEVASHTPELWSFWGNTLEQWSRRYKTSGTSPVDLTLNSRLTVGSHVFFDGPLREAVRDRAARGLIRSVHFQNRRTKLLTSILPLLIPDGEGIPSSSIESIRLEYVDVSDFFVRCRFPKLWYLHLSRGIKIPSWECLGLHTTALTTLHLEIREISNVLTTRQLLSVLAPNPRLQNLTLRKYAIPHDNGGGSTLQVPLCHLKNLSLDGVFGPIFQLLHRLEHPDKMDEIVLTVSGCTAEDTLGTLGPYLRDYLQRDGRFRGGLGIFVRSLTHSVSVRATTISSDKAPRQKVASATFTAILGEDLPSDPAVNKLCIDFIAYTPREQVVYFGGDLSMVVVRGTVPAMPKIQEVHLTGALLSNRFLQPDPAGPLAGTKLLPSLRHLHLEDTILNDDDWSPLIHYLSHQTSGGQAISLTLSGWPVHICTSVVTCIEGLVHELILDLSPSEDYPFRSSKYLHTCKSCNLLPSVEDEGGVAGGKW